MPLDTAGKDARRYKVGVVYGCALRVVNCQGILDSSTSGQFTNAGNHPEIPDSSTGG
jgi:hypothetical protein